MKWFKSYEDGQKSIEMKYRYSSPIYVYAIRTEKMIGESSEFWNGYVKIGVASNVEKRLKTIQTGCPYNLTILNAILCYSENQAYAIEKYIHERFKKENTSGEWFKMNTRVESFILCDFKKLGPPAFIREDS